MGAWLTASDSERPKERPERMGGPAVSGGQGKGEAAEFTIGAGRGPSSAGFGVQFNQNVYASITPPPKGPIVDLEQKVIDLAPQFVRLFFNATQAKGTNRTPGTLDSFKRTVNLAQRAGATINITIQSVAPYVAKPEAGMNEFADLLETLVQDGATNLRWVTLQNEPNSVWKNFQPVNPTTRKPMAPSLITPPLLNHMYRLLAAELAQRRLRERIRFMGGDLLREQNKSVPVPDRIVFPKVANDLPKAMKPPAIDPSVDWWRKHAQEDFYFAWMAENMHDILDAYSVHIYWFYDDSPQGTAYFQARLPGVQTMGARRRGAGRKPVYVTEYGVRGFNKPPYTKTNPKPPAVPNPSPGYFLDNGDPMWKTTVAAFQTAWFQLVAAQTGYVGMAKWDCYWGRYDSGTQSWFAIGQPLTADGKWPLSPMYYLLWLFAHAAERGWPRVELTNNSRLPSSELAGFGLASDLTILGLDSRGKTTTRVAETSPATVSYTIKGTPTANLNLIVWNRAGDGKLAKGTVAVSDRIARFTVPLQAVFALTTKELGQLPT